MKQTEADVLCALAKKHSSDLWFPHVKTGPTQGADAGLLVLDGVAVKKSWSRWCVTGYEVKTSRSDFMCDTKWPEYKALCNRFSWACPSGLIAPSEIAADVGLVWVNDAGGWSVRKAAPFRDVPPDAGLLQYLLLWRVEDAPTPSNRLRVARDYLAGKADAKDVGYKLASKFAREVQDAKGDAERWRDKAEGWERAAHEVGIRSSWELADFKGEAIPPGLSRAVVNALAEARRTVKYLEAAERLVTDPVEKAAAIEEASQDG